MSPVEAKNCEKYMCGTTRDLLPMHNNIINLYKDITITGIPLKRIGEV